MADIVFLDWNNYTDRDGSAQTLDWDNLPGFLDIGAGITALIYALNEKIVVVNEVAGNKPDDLTITAISISQFEINYGSVIDSKIQDLNRYFFNLDTYPNSLASWDWSTLKASVELDLSSTWIKSNPFSSHTKEWLLQRYTALNKLVYIKSILGQVNLGVDSDFKVKYKTITDWTGNYTDLVVAFDALPYLELTEDNRSFFEHKITVGWEGFPKYKEYGMNRVGPVFPSNFFSSSFKCYRGVLMMSFSFDSYENNDSNVAESVVHEYIMSQSTVAINSAFDYTNFYDAATVTDFDPPGQPSLNRKGYNTQTSFGLVLNQNWVFKMNVPDGFKFQ